jgi:hypothetical protein
MPNVSKVPTLDKWRALLQDEIQEAGVPTKGTPLHPSEEQMTGSHTSIVIAFSGPQKVMRADTRMEIKAREPISS